MGQNFCDIPASGSVNCRDIPASGSLNCLCFKVPRRIERSQSLLTMLVRTVASTLCVDCVLIKLSCCNFLTHTDRTVLEPQD